MTRAQAVTHTAQAVATPACALARAPGAAGACLASRATLVRRMSDDQLVAAARRGEEAAFEAIVERYRSPLLGHCRRVAGSASAPDALQQAFLSAWRALRGGCDVRDLRHWLFAIAHRSAISVSRDERERSRPPLAAAHATSTPADDFELSILTRETLAAIAALPQRERDALERTAVQGRSGHEVARELGVSESALRQLVYRARAHARASMPALLPPALLTRFGAGLRRLAASATTSATLGAPESGGLLLKISAATAVALLATLQLSARHGERRQRATAPPVTAEAHRASHSIAATPGSPASRAPSVAHVPGRRYESRRGASRGATGSRTHAEPVPAGGSSAAPAHATLAVGRHADGTPSSGASKSAGATAATTRPVREGPADPAPQVIATVGQIAAPVQEVTHTVISTATQLPATIEDTASGSLESGSRQIETLSTAVTETAGDTVGGTLRPSGGRAPLAAIEALGR
jgi:RNA polymerase sigma factor (sigma-70 family)